MKKYLSFLVLCTLLFTLCGCASSADQTNPEASGTEESDAREQPDISQIRAICELATLECYYHNVSKSTKSKGSGLTHWFEQDRTFWIEYTGVVKIGVDMSEVTLQMDGNKVTITMPKAKVLDCKVDEISEEDYIISEDTGINKNPITAEEQTQAVKNAQEEMRQETGNNTKLLMTAQEQAKKLIENYIFQLGDAAGVKYQVIWEDSAGDGA